MARPRLSNEIRESIERLYFADGMSISAVAKALTISRNSVKSVLRSIEGSRGLRAAMERKATEQLGKVSIPEDQLARSDVLKVVDLERIQQLFEEFKGEGDNRTFSRIQRFIESVAVELEVFTTTDMLRIEAALYHYLLHRQSFFRAMKIMSSMHGQNWVDSFEKMSRASSRLMETSIKSSEKFLGILKELEIRAGVRLPVINRANIFVHTKT